MDTEANASRLNRIATRPASYRWMQLFMGIVCMAMLAPCTPSKIVALWNNFHALGAKLGKSAPAHPLFLIKPASSLAGPGDAILRPSRYEGRIAFEGELGLVIARRCRDVPLSEA